MYAIEFISSAARELADLDLATRRRVARRLDRLAAEPRGGGALKLRGADDIWRVRVGEYRILYRIEDARLLILVIRVGHRRDIYR